MTRHYLDRLAEVIRTNWNQPALTDYATLDGGEGNSYTYGEMYGQICALCDRFRQLGIQKGDHIAICGANSANWAVAYLAIAAYQAVSVTILHSQTPEEIARQIVFSDTKVIITDRNIGNELQTQCRFSSIQMLLMEEIGALESIQDTNVSFVYTHPEDLAQLCFTSGSNDIAKAVMLPIRSLSNNVQNIIEGFPSSQNSAMLSILPLAHVFGLTTEVLGQLVRGKHIFLLGADISWQTIWQALNRVKPYALSAIPFYIETLSNRYSHSFFELLRNQCQQLHIGGAALNPNVEKDLLNHHIPFSVGYGATEAGPLISDSLWQNYHPYSCGKVVSGMEASISPQGEILVRGENVMLGYYKDPEATAAKIDKDGWLHTGDRGHLDEDGNLYVEGRLEQDMVVLPSGENISLPNVESIINQVDGVEESLVLVRNGHLVALVYTSANLNRQNLLRTINPQLPSFSQLYDLEFVSVPFQRTEKRTIKRYLYQ